MQDAIKQYLKERPILYIARDIERAIGGIHLDNFYIATNNSQYAQSFKKDFKDKIILIDKKETLDTVELLQQPEVIDFIKKIRPFILVFKNTPQIEKICSSMECKLLNPPSKTANEIEEKISQIEWLDENQKYLPDFEITECKNIIFENTPFIIQYNHGHTGQGTILVEKEEELEEIKQKFPHRIVKKSKYIDGPMYTVNCVAASSKIILGNISLQITGIQPFTDLKFSTVGNDFSIPYQYLDVQQKNQIEKIATDIGLKMSEDDWCGLFGIDIKIDEKNGKVYLIEINARQPASSTFESELQSKTGVSPTIFEAHLYALLSGVDKDKDEASPQFSPDTLSIQKINNGSQIVQRITNAIKDLNQIDIERLKKLSWNMVSYNNSEPNSDLIRIKLRESIMKDQYVLNELGVEIANIIKK